MATKSLKPRGPVKLTKEGAGGTISKTANPYRENPNVGRGPTTGNQGVGSKQKDFLSTKSDRGSYLKQMADMVSGAFGQRGAAMKPNLPATEDKQALKSISPVTRVKRGPTRG